MPEPLSKCCGAKRRILYDLNTKPITCSACDKPFEEMNPCVPSEQVMEIMGQVPEEPIATPRSEMVIEFAMAMFDKTNPARFEHITNFARQLERELILCQKSSLQLKLDIVKICKQNQEDVEEFDL